MAIAPNHVLKQTRPGKHLDIMVFKAFNKDANLCIVKSLSQYLDRTRHLRNGDTLLIST